MPRFTVLHGERPEGKRENGEDADVKKYVEMLDQAGFQTAVSHVWRSIKILEGPRLREYLLGGPSLFPKRLRTEQVKALPEKAT